MIDINDIRSLTDFQRNAKTYMKRLSKTGTPLILTVNGKASAVVVDPQDYQKIMERLEYTETLEAIREADKEFAEGKGIPLEKAVADLSRELGIQDRSLAKSKARSKKSSRLDGSKLVARGRRHRD